jgi:hypothetical protein
MTECYSKVAIALLLTVAALATPAAAQELSVGYQVQRFSGDGDSLNVPFGLNISLAGAGSLTAVGQLDWSRKHESETFIGTSVDATANFAAFAGGVRLSGHYNPSATPFVEALFGLMRTSGSANIAGEKIDGGSTTDPLLQVGGGVSVPMGGPFGVFGQVDYRRIFADDARVNGVRFVAGIRLTAR